MDNESSQEAQDITNVMPTDISWEELEHMTDGFSEEREIGRGGYGVVYMGVQENGKKIAVKKLHHMPGLDEKQFQNEIQILTRLEHQNIVRLIGQTYKEQEKCVEYNGKLVLAIMVDRVICLEYLHNGSLQNHISDESSGLPWHKRYQIIKGICEGLNYLHEHSIFHLDLKPCNILLDDNMLPKIADFGLSRLFSGTRKSHTTTHFIGTFGCMPPEYIEKRKISDKYDVFSLGVIIILIVSGPNGNSKRCDMTSQDFIELVHGNWNTRLPKPELGDASYFDAHSNQVKACIKIALNCLESDRHKRPSIRDVVCTLNELETTIGESNKQLVAVHTQAPTERTMDLLLGFTKSVMERLLSKAKSFVNEDTTTTSWWRCMLPPLIAAAPLPLDDAVAEIEQLKVKVEDVSTRNSSYNLISESGSNPVIPLQHPSLISEPIDRFIYDMETKPEFDIPRGLLGWMDNYFRTCQYYIKPCILYLFIFSQGQCIRRRRVVRRWIAEGYLRGTSHQSAEENGEKFFSMLLDLSIIQQAPHSVTTADTKMVWCKVSGFVREYIISRQKDEKLVFELEGRCTLISQHTGRHLAINESWDRDKIVFSSIDFSRLRSLTVFGEWKPFFINETMQVLRVLDLENAMGLTYECLGQMLKLLPRLKFLSLRGQREICHLPRSFAALRQLETLDVRDTSIVTLPPSITKLTKLQYIRAGTAKEPAVPCGVEVPAGIWKLTALHTLGAVNVGDSGGKAILKEIKQLTQLQKLEVTGVNNENSNEFCSAISDHVHLESLAVWLSMGNNQHFSEDMFSTLENPLKKLQTLKLYGPLRSVPAWIKDLPKLTKLELELEVTTSVQFEENNVLRVLGEFQQLRILRLHSKPLEDGDSNLDFRVTVAGMYERCYLRLKVLEIICRSNLTVTFGSHSMVNLELLSARCCSGSVLKFTELNNLSRGQLKEVRYLGSRDNTHKDMETQLKNHPKRPALMFEFEPYS